MCERPGATCVRWEDSEQSLQPLGGLVWNMQPMGGLNTEHKTIGRTKHGAYTHWEDFIWNLHLLGGLNTHWEDLCGT